MRGVCVEVGDGELGMWLHVDAWCGGDGRGDVFPHMCNQHVLGSTCMCWVVHACVGQYMHVVGGGWVHACDGCMWWGVHACDCVVAVWWLMWCMHVIVWWLWGGWVHARLRWSGW